MDNPPVGDAKGAKCVGKVRLRILPEGAGLRVTKVPENGTFKTS